MNLSEESLEYHDGDTELRGLLVAGDRGAKRPGVLVVHGGAGLDDHAKGRARQRLTTELDRRGPDRRAAGGYRGSRITIGIVRLCALRA